MGNVSLAVQRIAASGPRAGTIVLLAGGPGQPALPPFEALHAPLAHLRALRDYELVSFDQRGTGQSGALLCPGFARRGLAALTECGEALGSARADYTSQDSVEDLEELRRALGGTPLSLLAVSYGGKVAAMYAREYPAGVARMVLDSPVPLAGSDALDSQRPRALHRVLDEELCGAGACRAFTSDPYRALVKLLSTLRRRLLRVQIVDSRGRREVVTVTEDGVYGVISEMDLSPYLRALVPAAIVAAVAGDTVPLARLVSNFRVPAPAGADLLTGVGALSPAWLAGAVGGEALAQEAEKNSLSVTLLAATLCAESPLPWLPESPLATRAATLRDWLSQLPAGTTAPFTPFAADYDSAIRGCIRWPPTPPAPPPPTGVSATPTLILSGNEDLREPYEQDLTVSAGYSDVQLLRIPGTGHSTVSSDPTGCALRAAIAFLGGGQAPSSCAPLGGSQVLPPPPSSLRAVRSAGSSSRLAGRGVTAAAMTLQEILGQPSFSGGGLRSGFWHLRGTRLVLSRVVDIPGVSLSGSVQLARATARLKVWGRVSGTLNVKGLAVSGRLNGAEVHARLIQ